MEIKGAKYGEYKEVIEGKIRVRTVKYIDPQWGDECLDYEYSIFKRPYFFGMFGKKKWEEAITTSFPDMGLEFSKHLLGIENQ